MVLTAFVIGFLATFLVFAAILIALRNIFRDGYFSGLMIGLGNAITQIPLIFLMFVFLHLVPPSEIAYVNKYFIAFTAFVLFCMAYDVRKHPEPNKQKMTFFYTLKLIATGFGLSIIFPVTITTYLGLLHHYGALAQDKWVLALTVMAGNLVWWIIFVSIVSCLSPCGRMSPAGLKAYDRLMVLIITLLGIATLATLFMN